MVDVFDEIDDDDDDGFELQHICMNDMANEPTAERQADEQRTACLTEYLLISSNIKIEIGL